MYICIYLYIYIYIYMYAFPSLDSFMFLLAYLAMFILVKIYSQTLFQNSCPQGSQARVFAASGIKMDHTKL